MEKQNQFWLSIFSLNFWFKLFICYIAIYIGIAFGYSLFNPPLYKYTEDDFWSEIVTVLYRPTSELLFNSQINSWPNFIDIDFKNQMSNVPSTEIKSYNSKTIVSLSPRTSSNISWSLVYCENLNNQFTCKRHKLNYLGNQEFIIKKDLSLWALGLDGRYYPLNIIYKNNIDKNIPSYQV